MLERKKRRRVEAEQRRKEKEQKELEKQNIWTSSKKNKEHSEIMAMGVSLGRPKFRCSEQEKGIEERTTE